MAAELNTRHAFGAAKTTTAANNLHLAAGYFGI